jgi:hypothetical protein
VACVLRRASKLKAANTESFLLLAQLYYTVGAPATCGSGLGTQRVRQRTGTAVLQMGERNDALAQIRECVKLDADDKPCFEFYKKLKNLNKLAEKIDAGLSSSRLASFSSPRTLPRPGQAPCERLLPLTRLNALADTQKCCGIWSRPGKWSPARRSTPDGSSTWNASAPPS